MKNNTRVHFSSVKLLKISYSTAHSHQLNIGFSLLKYDQNHRDEYKEKADVVEYVQDLAKVHNTNKHGGQRLQCSNNRGDYGAYRIYRLYK